MKAIGGLLLVFGIIGLLLSLILWLPTEINSLVVLFISITCLMFIWGGGKLSLAAVGTGKERAKKNALMAEQACHTKHKVVCHRCGGQVATGQRFCGNCGVNLMSHCPSCGAAIISPSKFCEYCGTRLF